MSIFLYFFSVLVLLVRSSKLNIIFYSRYFFFNIYV